MNKNKLWLEHAQRCLENSLRPVPYETNGLDWKAALSDNKDRLVEHLSAFAEPDGTARQDGSRMLLLHQHT
jgi:ATP-dependent DNA helicase RecG